MKIKISESQFKTVVKTKLQESMIGTNTGAIEMDKSASQNPAAVKKFTDQGINVKVVDEELMNSLDETLLDETLGEEQEVTLKYKLEHGKKLNIYSTRDKIVIRDVLKYITTIDDQDMVERAFNEGKVSLFVKVPSSGRYNLLGTFDQGALMQFKSILNKDSETPDDSFELNEEVSID